MNPPRKKPAGKAGWRFLGIVVLLYVAVALFDSALIQPSLDFFGHTVHRILPVLALVFVIMWITDMVINPQRASYFLGSQSGRKGWLIAIGSGIMSVGPIYPWYGVLAELRQQGMRYALVSAFIYSRAIKLPLLPLMAHYFGVAFTILICCYLIVFAIVNGLIMQRLENRGFFPDRQT